MTIPPFHLLCCWRASPPCWQHFPLLVLIFNFLCLPFSRCSSLLSCQTWAALWRPRGPKLYLRARALSSTRRGSTASPGRRSPGSETGGRFPPAAACESTFHLGFTRTGVFFTAVCLSTCAHLRAVLRTTSSQAEYRIHFAKLREVQYRSQIFSNPSPHTHTATPKLSGSS